MKFKKFEKAFPSEWAFEVDLQADLDQTAFLFSIEDSTNQLELEILLNFTKIF